MKSPTVLHELYIELVKLQKHIISTNTKLLLVLEGRDAAGKDGTIKRITKHLSPRESRVVALGKPSYLQDREWYFERYTQHLPLSCELVIFNRSWYNRAGVEKVMGFCTTKQYKSFFKEVELFEQMLVEAGFVIFKYYLDISKKEQKKRLDDRVKDPLKQWKTSPIDEVAIEHWKDYSDTRDEMLLKTNFDFSPWFVVSADNKDETHIDLITHLLKRLDYHDKNKTLLSHKCDLVFPASTENIRLKLF